MADPATAGPTTGTATTGPTTDPAPLAAPEDRGTLEVRTKAVEHIIARVVLDLDETVEHRSSLAPLTGGYPKVSVSVHGAWARADVTVAATWPCAVTDLAARVRDAVISRTPPMAGIAVRTVDVSVHVVSAADPANPRAAATRRVA